MVSSLFKGKKVHFNNGREEGEGQSRRPFSQEHLWVLEPGKGSAWKQRKAMKREGLESNCHPLCVWVLNCHSQIHTTRPYTVPNPFLLFTLCHPGLHYAHCTPQNLFPPRDFAPAVPHIFARFTLWPHWGLYSDGTFAEWSLQRTLPANTPTSITFPSLTYFILLRNPCLSMY